jgi:hypothetical protein
MYFDNENDIEENDIEENNIEECYEEIYHIETLLQYIDECENKFLDKINNLWDEKLKEISCSTNIYIDTDNFNHKKQFINFFKESDYYIKLKKNRNKLEKRKHNIFCEIKELKRTNP